MCVVPYQDVKLKTQQHLEGLEKSISDLKLANLELGTRVRLMTELADAHENHIDRLSSNAVWAQEYSFDC